MFSIFLITVVTLAASLAAFFSGFGLGTILMPIVALFFPLPIAIMLTAIVHLFHNLLKTGLLWKKIDWTVALQFGIAAWIAAIPGALLLKIISTIPPLKTYTFHFIHGRISILHIIVGMLLIFFAAIEWLPNKRFQLKNLYLGGALSGFFGGLSGFQGAFRSFLLLQEKMKPDVFIATNACIATAVDIVRVAIYSFAFHKIMAEIQISLLSGALVGATAGILIGMVFVKKITLQFLRNGISLLLFLFGILLIIGWI